jgi:4-amino-4-deoxy-L-arabinose transferase-like glycosyltransferase
VSNGLHRDSSLGQFCSRHFVRAAAVVLTLAAFNLCFRLDREVVTEWDESLYATSAAETARHGNWIATTFHRELDYYNTKPPLNIWLIAASFKAFGPDLVSLRLPSVIAAWLTVLVLMIWTARSFGVMTALFAGLVLSTTFGFIYVHSGRSANTDALFTLFMLLIVVTLWGSYDRPWRLVWLGPLVAGIFLLRGMAVLMPLALIGVVQILDLRKLRERWLPLSVATVLLALPVAGWVFARWQVDEWRFLERMFHYDFVARSARALEGHTGSPVYYLNVLQKDQYDWLLAATGAIVLFPISLAAVRQRLAQSTRDRYFAIVLASWIAVTLLIPTAMRTKVAWYLNPFFPVFALLVAVTLARGLGAAGAQLRRRQRVLAGLVLLALAVAEGKLIWYSYNMRDLNFSAQGILLDERERLAGQRVFRDRWPSGGRFILEQIVGGEAMQAHDEQDFRKKGDRGDFLLLTRSQVAYSQLSCPRTNHRYALCRYPD